MLENLEICELGALQNRVHELFDAGYRFVTITCANALSGKADEAASGGFDIFYSFDLNFKMANLQITVPVDQTIASISGTYLAAAFAENEISELFGVKISGKAIDYGGRFMLSQDAPESPFGAGVIIVKKDGGSNAR